MNTETGIINLIPDGKNPPTIDAPMAVSAPCIDALKIVDSGVSTILSHACINPNKNPAFTIAVSEFKYLNICGIVAYILFWIVVISIVSSNIDILL